jgi:predicted DNA-binding protein (MmcQ/YjbR family)
MNIETLHTYCLAKKGVEASFPFGEDTLVFKVGGKIFLLTGLNSSPLQFNVKCHPEKAIEWREQYDAVQPGYHMNKKHWNTVVVDGSIPNKVIQQMIDDSYELVVQSLPKSIRDTIV